MFIAVMMFFLNMDSFHVWGSLSFILSPDQELYYAVIYGQLLEAAHLILSSCLYQRTIIQVRRPLSASTLKYTVLVAVQADLIWFGM